jgi:hypothetical protein
MRLFFARPARPRPPPAHSVQATSLAASAASASSEASAATPSVAALGNDVRLVRWRALTLDGNVALERGERVRARQLFEEALAVAEGMLVDATLQNADHCAVDVAPLLHGISCNDIAELARQQGDRETSGIYLYRRVSCLITVIESSLAPLELRTRCLSHLKVASGGLYAYFEQAGMWDAAAAFSARSNAAMFSVQRLQPGAAGVPLPEDPFA